MMDTKILVIEDEVSLSEPIKTYFENEGYDVKVATDGSEGISFFKMYDPDIVILDITLPKKDGWQVCREIRENSAKPIIMISTKGDVFDKVLGLELGADDYMVKPIDFHEMSLRIKAVLRRAKIVSERKIFVGSVVLDYETLTVSKEDTKVSLTKKEFGILYKLLSYPERSFSKTALFEEFWSWDSDTEEDIVKVYVNRIRNKIEPFSEIDVETVRGIGYRGIKNEDAKQ